MTVLVVVTVIVLVVVVAWSLATVVMAIMEVFYFGYPLYHF